MIGTLFYFKTLTLKKRKKEKKKGKITCVHAYQKVRDFSTLYLFCT